MIDDDGSQEFLHTWEKTDGQYVLKDYQRGKVEQERNFDHEAEACACFVAEMLKRTLYRTHLSCICSNWITHTGNQNMENGADLQWKRFI